MGKGGRYSELEPSATSKTMTLIFPDGRLTPLKTIREEATRRLHMSPTTVSKALKQLEDHGFLTRTVDGTTRPPRVFYKRTASSISQKENTFDEWFEKKLRIIEFGLLIILREIALNPKTPVGRLVTIKKLEIKGGAATSVFELSVLDTPWHILFDFQQMLRSGTLRDTQGLKRRIEEIMRQT